jgi:nicotinamidase/pyrazinamidase
MSGKALILIDVQRDFCPGGSYPVPAGDEVVSPLNTMIQLAKEQGWKILASRDWHPKSTQNMEGWTAHCIENTQGAEFHPELKIDDSITIISKGNQDLSDKHYSAFNGDFISLKEELDAASIKELYIGGLATDYCVKNTALDSVENGYKTFIFTDACRGIFRRKTQEEVLNELKAAGVHLTTIQEVLLKK